MKCWGQIKWFLVSKFLIYFYTKSLKSEQKQEGHHQTEKTHSLGQGESQDSVWKELLLEGRVTGITDDKGTEDRSNSCSWTSDSDGGSTSTNEFGGGVNVLLDDSGSQGSGSLKKENSKWRFWPSGKNYFKIYLLRPDGSNNGPLPTGQDALVAVRDGDASDLRHLDLEFVLLRQEGIEWICTARRRVKMYGEQ